jgi:hypothetical protein
MLVLTLPERPVAGRSGATASRGAARAALPVAHRASAADDPALAQQAQAFDAAVRLRSEAEREMNALQAMSMEQIKRDDELLKKWIALI